MTADPVFALLPGPLSPHKQRSTSKSLEMDLLNPHPIDNFLFREPRSVQSFPCIFVDEVFAPYATKTAQLANFGSSVVPCVIGQ